MSHTIIATATHREKRFEEHVSTRWICIAMIGVTANVSETYLSLLV
jgi:hypothetical protein